MVRYLRLILVSVFVLVACNPEQEIPTFQQLASPYSELCKIAIFPFVNTTEFVQGDLIVYRVFISELHNDIPQMQVALEGDVRKAFRQQQISPKRKPNVDQIKIISDRLGVDAVITGEIMVMTEEARGNAVNPALAVNLSLVESSSGKTVWSTYHSRAGEDFRKIMHFGKVNTITRLAQLVSKEILEQWQKEGLGEQCSKI